MKKMIPYAQALRIVLAQNTVFRERRIPLSNAHGYIVTQDVRASVDNPPFRQSAMDGYALRYKQACTTYQLPEKSLDVPAGQWNQTRLKPGQAIRIFTGARLPDGADTVVAQEHVEIKDGLIHIRDVRFGKGRNVRPQGSHFRKGSVLLKRGSRINCGAIALLSQSGITLVRVGKRPKVGVLVTGDELIPAGKSLSGASVYESNSATLSALLSARGIREVRISTVSDDPRLIRRDLLSLLRWADVVLVTGGVSVGDYDHVPYCMEAAGIEILFHKIRQKPGKPVLFGRKGQRFVFGLPGNPGSVISCFHSLVAPLLSKIEGEKSLVPVIGRLKNEVKVKGDLTHFLKARMEGGMVEILDGQESYKVDAFVHANVLVMIEGGQGPLHPGDQVTCIPIQQ